jgi:filamentous hemagglutinin family protein
MKNKFVNFLKLSLYGFGSCILCLINCLPTLAEITPDATLPVNSTVLNQGNIKIIEGGTQRGNNLFHSFKDFSFSALTPNITGDTAFFNNDVGIRNIITRVTGGLPSNIDGIIQANGSANLFFLNPTGITFGKNAALNIGGSFISTTADSIIFLDGSIFSANQIESNPLLTISVPMGLQFGANPGAIINQSQSNLNGEVNIIGLPVGLKVTNGKTLGLVGGNVSLIGGNLTAEAGRIEIGSIAANGFVGLSEIDKGYSFEYSGVRDFENIQLSQAANIDTSGDGGGSIQLFGKNISLDIGSAIFSIASGSKTGENILISATNSLELNGGSSIGTLANGESKAGDVLLKVFESIKLSGTGSEGSPNVIASQVCLMGSDCNRVTGSGGNLILETKQLIIQDRGSIDTSTFGVGQAGNIFIQASDFVEITGQTPVEGSQSGIFAQVGQDAIDNPGNAGNLRINTQRLIVKDGGQISTAARKAGDGGNLNINAVDSIILSGTSGVATASLVDSNRSGLFVSAELNATGNVGSLNLTTGKLTVENGARISADNLGSGLPANSTLNVNQLIIKNGGEVRSGSFSSGNGGTLTVNASKSINIQGNFQIADQTISSTLFSQGTSTSTGQAGNLIVNTPNFNVGEGGEVTVSAVGTGAAGNLTVNANNIQLNQGKLTAQTNAGGGANINLNDVKILRLEKGSLISAEAFNAANAGNISINAPNGFIIAFPNENSDITANAFTGAGGRVDIKATGIFGIEPRSRNDLINRLGSSNRTELNPQRLESNDITAISQDNPSLEGQVSITTPDVDPSQGISEFPVSPINLSNLTDSSCAAFGPNSPNQFIITGRGGLPPSPNDPLTPDALWTDDRMVIIPNQDLKPQKKQESRKKTTTPASEMIPATGWVFNDKGEVMLVASNSNSLPYGLASIPCAR